MHNEQEGAALRLDPRRADGVPTLFRRFAVDAVRINEAIFILEDQRRQFK